MIHCYVCSNQMQNPTNHTQGMLSELSMLHELTSTAWLLERLLKIHEKSNFDWNELRFFMQHKSMYYILHGVLSNHYNAASMCPCFIVQIHVTSACNISSVVLGNV